ncbi:MAG: inorganic diphosphatase [Acidaminobacteraceae bacterium]
MDRQLGTKHPRYDLIYPVNYGYIEGTLAGDGDEIDAYVLGEFEPLAEYEGKVIGVIIRSNDNEDKLVVAKNLNSYSKDQIIALTEFQERYYESELITFDYLKQAIRNTVKAIIKSEEKILVLEEEYQGKTYYHLPGGGIEYLEESDDALVREIYEEIGCKIETYSLYKTITNIFELDGMKAHEILQVYKVVLEIDPKSLVGKLMTGDITNSKFRLINSEEFKLGKKVFHPEKLIEYL